MSLEEIIKNCRHVLTNKNSYGDERCYFEDEVNKILYVFGPSSYIRSSFTSSDQTEIGAIDFEGGPYIGINDEVLANKFAVGIGLTYDHGIPLASISYDAKPAEKKKKKKTKKSK